MLIQHRLLLIIVTFIISLQTRYFRQFNRLAFLPCTDRGVVPIWPPTSLLITLVEACPFNSLVTATVVVTCRRRYPDNRSAVSVQNIQSGKRQWHKVERICQVGAKIRWQSRQYTNVTRSAWRCAVYVRQY